MPEYKKIQDLQHAELKERPLQKT